MIRKPLDRDPFEYAISYLAKRDRSRYEMEAYLGRKGFDAGMISETVTKLADMGLINDASYAERFVRSRVQTKPTSRYALSMQLSEKGIDKAIINDTLGRISEEDEFSYAVSIAAKYLRQYQTLDNETKRAKVLSRLAYRGFGYDMSQKAFEKAESSLGETI